MKLGNHLQERGLHIKGHTPSLGVMDEYRVCLAPLRFGAGLKGKIVDSWLHGMPVVTTPIGAEGLFAEGMALHQAMTPCGEQAPSPPTKS